MDGGSFEVGRTAAQEVHDRHVEFILRCMGELVGGLMLDPNVTDIILNEDGQLWVTKLGVDSHPVGTMSASNAESLIGATASTLGKVATKETPIIEGELLTDGSRFIGIIPPVVKSPVFSIRKKASAVIPLEVYEQRGLMTAKQREVIVAAVRAKKNIIVTGGTGSGKTTLLNGILHSVAIETPEDRVLIGEDTREAQCSSPNHVFLRTCKGVTLSDVLAAMLRMFPDRICIGEVRRGEAFDLLVAWNTGHPGGVCSVHSDIVLPRAALSRLELMVSMSPTAPPSGAPIQRLIAEAVGLIVCVKRMPDGTRRVTKIVSVEGFDGHDYILKVEDETNAED
jgi:type IV secretion system protein VirB11